MFSTTFIGAITESTGLSSSTPAVPSSTIVPTPKPSPITALFADTKLKLTLKVSAPSKTGLAVSFKMDTVIVLVVSPGAKVTLPEIAV